MAQTFQAKFPYGVWRIVGKWNAVMVNTNELIPFDLDSFLQFKSLT